MNPRTNYTNGKVQCARIFKSKKQQCPNVGIIHYMQKDEFRGIWITYSLCRRCSPNVLKENKKGDVLFVKNK